MKKILLIEDDGFLKENLITQLNSKGYMIKSANDCTSAIGLWKKYKGDFDCLILDLNINPHGLTITEIDRYFPIHGILVLEKISNEVILGMEERTLDEKREEIWKRTIAYSAFIDRFNRRRNEFPNGNYLQSVRKECMTSVSDLIEKVTEFLK